MYSKQMSKHEHCIARFENGCAENCFQPCAVPAEAKLKTANPNLKELQGQDGTAEIIFIFL